MGGNVKFANATVERFPTDSFTRRILQEDFMYFLAVLSDNYGNNRRLPRDRRALTGSSVHLFNPSISDEEIFQLKPTMGDIDVIIPSETNIDQLIEALYNSVTTSFEVMDTKRISTQLSAAVRFIRLDRVIQVDFELKPYLLDSPTAFSALSNNVHIDDLRAGISGVFHKQLLCACTARTSRPRLVLTTIRGKQRISVETESEYVFSVAKGVRNRYVEIPSYGWSNAYTKAKVEDANYIQSLDEIGTILFGPRFSSLNASERIKNLHSFDGVVKLMHLTLGNRAFFRVLADFQRRLTDPKTNVNATPEEVQWLIKRILQSYPTKSTSQYTT